MTHDENSTIQGLPEAEHRRYGRIFLAVSLAGRCSWQGRWCAGGRSTNTRSG